MGETNGEFRTRQKFCISIDSDGNVFTTGLYAGTVEFDPGAGTAFLVAEATSSVYIQKLDNNGDFLWVKAIDTQSGGYGKSISTDSNGNIISTGYFEGTTDFDTGSGTLNISSEGDNDVYIQKLDSDGLLMWVKTIGGTRSDEVFSGAIDANSNIYSTGRFTNTVDFDPGMGVTNLTSIGSSDIFIHIFSQCVTTSSTDVAVACDSFTWMDGNTYEVTQEIGMEIFPMSVHFIILISIVLI